MGSSGRGIGSGRLVVPAIPLEEEEEQRRYYDHRVPTWPLRLAGLAIGYMWLTQLFWKLPWNKFVAAGETPNGVIPNTELTLQQPGPFVDNGLGLYHWMVQEAIYGNRVLPGYGDLIRTLVLPNWQLFGWITFFLEGTIAVLFLLGLLTRLGGFLALLQGINLYIGLSAREWPWTYGMLIALSVIFMFTGEGRFLGADQFLRPKLRDAIIDGRWWARVLYLLT